MTSRERILSVLYGNKPDRIPWCPEINSVLVEKLIKEKGYRIEDVSHPYSLACEIIGADCLGGANPVVMEYKNIKVKNHIQGDENITAYETPKGTLISRRKYDAVAKTEYITEHLLKGIEDFRIYQYIIENLELKPNYGEVEKIIRLIGDRGIPSLEAPQTPLMFFIMDQMGMGTERTLYELYDHEKEMKEIFALLHERNKEYYELASKSPGLMIRPFEDTSTSLYSSHHFEEYCAPFLDEYAEICYKWGKLFIPHMCGLLKGVIPILTKMKIDGIEAVTPPPTGDTEAVYMRELLGKGKIIIGGMDATTYSWQNREEIEKGLRKLLSEMKEDNEFILGSEEFSIQTREENIFMIREILNNQEQTVEMDEGYTTSLL